MNGADFVAVVRLSNRENETLALPGETCDRIPASSLAWLAEQGLVSERPRAPFASGGFVPGPATLIAGDGEPEFVHPKPARRREKE